MVSGLGAPYTTSICHNMWGKEHLGGGLCSPTALLVVFHVSLVGAFILVLCFSSPAELLFCFFLTGNILDSMLLKASNKATAGSWKETSSSAAPAPSTQSLLWCHCYHYCPEDSTNNTCRWAEIWYGSKQINKGAALRETVDKPDDKPCPPGRMATVSPWWRRRRQELRSWLQAAWAWAAQRFSVGWVNAKPWPKIKGLPWL